MMKLYCILFLHFLYYQIIFGDSWNPRRPKSEEEFNKLNHHERTTNLEEMNKKISSLKQKRDWKSWDENNPEFKATNLQSKKRPNIIMILADDLGYGDLSVQPFVQEIDINGWPCAEGGILSPNLERMATKGTIMSNFHSGSPVCSPSRLAVMTGLYPWRLGGLNAFELGRLDLSQRNGFLPQVLTSAEIFRNYGYYTAHSGKWHLGGMREEQRIDRVQKNNCSHPSPNQHGFEEYISELDGPESPRYTFLLSNSILHSQGHRHLLKDDIPMPILDRDPITLGEIKSNKVNQHTLSDHEAGDAIHFIKNHLKTNPSQPFYVNIWFNAPHGPWEILQNGFHQYLDHYNLTLPQLEGTYCKEDKEKLLKTRKWEYKSMVTAMDVSIGHILDALKELNIEEDTLVVFTSDNGPEVQAGTAGVFKEAKRSLHEGGVRVPAIFQWVGTIPANSITTSWGATTDLLPTFLDAANINLAEFDNTIRFDGLSLLPSLLNSINIKDAVAYYTSLHQMNGKYVVKTGLDKQNTYNSELSVQEFQTMLRELYKVEHPLHEHKNQDDSTIRKMRRTLGSNFHFETNPSILSSLYYNKTQPNHHNSIDNSERLFLWHKNTEQFHPRDDRVESSAYYKEVKIITSTYTGCLEHIYDLRHDHYESYNLINSNLGCKFNFQDHNNYDSILNKALIKSHCEGSMKITSDSNVVIDCMAKYTSTILDKIKYMFPRLIAFVKYGNKAHQRYMSEQYHNATCKVPLINDVVNKLVFHSLSDKCIEEYTCSRPLYWYN